MFRHVVLYTYKEDISKQEIKKIYDQLDVISSRLNGRLNYTWGEYDSSEGRNKNYTHAIVVDFLNEQSRDAFLHDKKRIEFSQKEVIPRMVNGVESIVSFDFVWEENQ